MNTLRREFLKLTGAGIGIAAAGVPLSNPATSVSVGDEGGFFDVRRFGATGDGTSIETTAVNRAIEEAASAGGGTVRFPAGTYAC